MSEENPICKILSIETPDMVYTGEGFEIDIRYINDGATGPTFIRMRDRLGNIYTNIDKEVHETGDGSSGFHQYQTMPKEHFIFQLEVGYGTAMNPIEITDTTMLFVINIEQPAPAPGRTTFNLSLVWPIVCAMPVIDMGFMPGQTLTKEAPVVSLLESAPVHKISFNVTGKGGVPDLNPQFTVDGEKWLPNCIYEIAGGQTIMFGITATLPVDMPAKGYQFRVGIIKREVLKHGTPS